MFHCDQQSAESDQMHKHVTECRAAVFLEQTALIKLQNAALYDRHPRRQSALVAPQLPNRCCGGQEGQQVQSQVIWRADQLQRDVAERQQELEQLRLSASAANAQRSVGDVDNDLDTVEADKAVAERAKDEVLRKQTRLRCALLTDQAQTGPA